MEGWYFIGDFGRETGHCIAPLSLGADCQNAANTHPHPRPNFLFPLGSHVILAANAVSWRKEI